MPGSASNPNMNGAHFISDLKRKNKKKFDDKIMRNPAKKIFAFLFLSITKSINMSRTAWANSTTVKKSRNCRIVSVIIFSPKLIKFKKEFIESRIKLSGDNVNK